MQKKKDGTVIASLTEVKNKTGDIFALVDEFGEVILTSYNKPRYKIIKTDISSVLDLTEKEPKVSEARAATAVKAVSRPQEPDQSKPMIVEIPTMIDRLINVSVWDRNNSKEVSFVTKATRGLLN